MLIISTHLLSKVLKTAKIIIIPNKGFLERYERYEGKKGVGQ